MKKIMTEELIIKNGEKDIYGKIYRPEGNGKFPAVILSHGYNGIHSDFTKECQYFAKNGYIAYAYDFCDTGNVCPLAKMYTLGNKFISESGKLFL